MNVRSILITLLGALLFITGCGKSSPPAPASHDLPSPRISKAEPGRHGGRLVLTANRAPNTFNTVSANPEADDVLRLICGSLISKNQETQELEPALAESWSISPDGKTWTFKLRPGLRWSDGAPLTAKDVVFTWNEVLLNPAVNGAGMTVFQVNGQNVSVTKVDDLTVRMVTPEVFAPLLELFGCAYVIPEHKLGQFARQRTFLSAYGLGTSTEHLVSAGPFRVKEVQPGKVILLERNPEYWVFDSQKRRLPYLDEVLVAPVEDKDVPTYFAAAKVDVVERPRPQTYAAFKQTAAAEKFSVYDVGGGTERDILWFNLNTNRNLAGQPLVAPAKLKWFQNKKFRQAISCAIDRDQLVREIYGGHGKPILTFYGEEAKKWNNPNVPTFGYDPARARALLAEIGIQDRNNDGVLEDETGAMIEFSFNSNTGNPVRERTATLIAGHLSKLGLKVNLQLIDYQLLRQRIESSSDYDCILLGLGAGIVDPASQVFVLKSSGPLHQWFPLQRTPASEWEARIDALMDAQMDSLDFAARKKLFDEVQMILADEMPMIYTAGPLHFAVARSDLANLRPSVITPYRLTWNIEELYLKNATPSTTNR